MGCVGKQRDRRHNWRQLWKKRSVSLLSRLFLKNGISPFSFIVSLFLRKKRGNKYIKGSLDQ